MARKLEEVGDRITNNQGFTGTIAEIITDDVDFFSQGRVVIDFDSGYSGEYSIMNVRRGIFSDYGQPNKVGGYAIGSGESVGPMRFVWYNMLSRCNNPEDKDYKDYGGRGVRVSRRWHYLENFIEDVKELDGYDKKLKYPDEYTLDKDFKVKGNLLYSKDTCVFSNHEQQSINRRNTVKISARFKDGKEIIFDSIVEASKNTGISEYLIGKKTRVQKTYEFNDIIFKRVRDDFHG